MGRAQGRRTGGRGGIPQHYGPRGRSGLQLPILVRRRPPCRGRGFRQLEQAAISWNRPPREDRENRPPILVVKLHEGNAAWRCDVYASSNLQQAAANVDVHHQCAYVVFLQWRTFQATAVGTFATAWTDWPSPRFTILRETRLCVHGNMYTNSRQEMPERC